MEKIVQMKIIEKKGCAGCICTKSSLQQIAKKRGFDVKTERVGKYGEKYFTNNKGQILQLIIL